MKRNTVQRFEHMLWAYAIKQRRSQLPLGQESHGPSLQSREQKTAQAQKGPLQNRTPSLKINRPAVNSGSVAYRCARFALNGHSRAYRFASERPSDGFRNDQRPAGWCAIWALRRPDTLALFCAIERIASSKSKPSLQNPLSRASSTHAAEPVVVLTDLGHTSASRTSSVNPCFNAARAPQRLRKAQSAIGCRGHPGPIRCPMAPDRAGCATTQARSDSRIFTAKMADQKAIGHHTCTQFALSIAPTPERKPESWRENWVPRTALIIHNQRCICSAHFRFLFLYRQHAAYSICSNAVASAIMNTTITFSSKRKQAWTSSHFSFWCSRKLRLWLNVGSSEKPLPLHQQLLPQHLATLQTTVHHLW